MRIKQEVKEAYVKDVIEGRKTAKEATEELGTHRATIYTWIQEYKSHHNNSNTINNNEIPMSKRELELEKEVNELKQELEFFKKAAMYFSKRI